MHTIGLLVVVVAVVVVAAIAVVFATRQRSAHLHKRFGPEYDRALGETGSKYRAEARLAKLEKRVEKFHISPLDEEDRVRFRERWRQIQAQFVDDPNGALKHADGLIGEVMVARGYPLSDFENQAAELSVDHPLIVENYRAGHAISLRQAQGRASTEDVRQAFIHYRTLFDDLVGQAARAKSAGSGN